MFTRLAAEQIFRQHDRDRNGKVDRKELKAILNSLGDEQITPHDVGILLANDDDDGDGFLTLQEFFRMINKRYTYTPSDDNYSFDSSNQPGDYRQGYQGYEKNPDKFNKPF